MGRSESGFMLLEVMVAVLILGIVIAGVIDIFIRSNYQVTSSYLTLQAIHLAQARLEELKATTYENVSNVDKTPYPGKPGFSYSVQVSPSVLGYNLKTVTVTIYYIERGNEKSLSLTMEKGKR
ncbi:hypothetical protein MOTE_21480 [Moorella thermoacetica]|uniref:Prepilin-type N-terminal cleavage/methylation domain-containing protein n=1 Tax=Neomoorella thermoacetica TaxID=1525 RepID=A0A1J5NIQ6_NEOTH|nr:hypothetical protein MOTE_21480 [Moorella thermoacetica]